MPCCPCQKSTCAPKTLAPAPPLCRKIAKPPFVRVLIESRPFAAPRGRVSRNLASRMHIRHHQDTTPKRPPKRRQRVITRPSIRLAGRPFPACAPPVRTVNRHVPACYVLRLDNRQQGACRQGWSPGPHRPVRPARGDAHTHKLRVCGSPTTAEWHGAPGRLETLVNVTVPSHRTLLRRAAHTCILRSLNMTFTGPTPAASSRLALMPRRQSKRGNPAQAAPRSERLALMPRRHHTSLHRGSPRLCFGSVRPLTGFSFSS